MPDQDRNPSAQPHTTGSAQADSVDNHHHFQPTVDCRKGTRAAGASFSPSSATGTDRSITVCYAAGGSHHPSHTTISALLSNAL
ncbi:hypothetical protein AB0F13_01120 [Streptomyces sp. NPDC026206]|uniref:hypothetical protein n=1 Tax=Streptomyces sp. NPDC026206 TaxID=3157089 RepID=UPI0033CD81CE